MTHAQAPDTDTNSNPAPVLIIHMSLVAAVVIVVVCPIVAIAANEEQYLTVFLVGGTDASHSFLFHSLPPTLTCFLLLINLFSVALSITRFLFFSKPTFFSFYHDVSHIFLLRLHFVAFVVHLISSHRCIHPSHAHVPVYNHHHHRHHPSPTYVTTSLF